MFIWDDGINWELSDANTFKKLISIVWDKKRFIIVGDEGLQKTLIKILLLNYGGEQNEIYS
jgi:uncharacterized ubiquitin-like protein YukD